MCNDGNSAPIKNYVVRLRRERGSAHIQTVATSPEEAIKLVCEDQGVSRSAVMSVHLWN